MLDCALDALGAERLLWGSDLTMCTGLAKLRALDVIGLSADDCRTFAGETPRASFRPAAFRAVRTLARFPAHHVSPVIDVNTLIGPYPFRYVPHPDPDVLVRVLDREGIDGAWVGHLPSAFYRDPSRGQHARCIRRARAVRENAAAGARRFDPIGPRGSRRFAMRRTQGAPAIRAYPPQWGMGPHDASMRELAIAAGEQGMAPLLTVRFEDLRQRHSMDTRRRSQRGGDSRRSRARATRFASS